MRKFFADLMNLSGVSVTFLLFMSLSLVVEGFVLYYLWLWFVVPLGVPALSVLNALGLWLLVTFLTYHFYDFKKSDDVGIQEPLCYLFVRPALTFLVGWVIHSLM